MNITSTLRKALIDLRQQRHALDTRIAAIETAIAGLNGRPAAARTAAPRRARRMSAAARAAVSRRMKAYWAKRRKDKKAA
jgi:hypothetical protein